MTSRFAPGSACYRCTDCGKLTRDTGSDEAGCRLCSACYQRAGLDNAHADGHHDCQPDPDCPQCTRRP